LASITSSLIRTLSIAIITANYLLMTNGKFKKDYSAFSKLNKNNGVLIHLHFRVLMRCQTSFFKKSLTGCNESAFGVAAKYKAPLKKCFTESVIKN